MRRTGFSGRCFACVAALAGEAFAQAPPPATQPAPAHIDALVQQLGDYRYAVRDAATTALSELSAAELPGLIRRYREEPRYEPKLRLRLAIERLFYHKLMEGESGFLGITPVLISSVYDPKTGQAVDCIIAETVHPGNPASKGGMQAKDVILDFDGQPVAKWMSPAHAPKAGEERPGRRVYSPSPPEIEAFTASVKRREPGTPIPVRVLRAVGMREFRVPGGIVDPQAFASTALPAPAGHPYGLGATIAGLAVTQVREKTWMADMGLGPNDVVVAVDGQPVPGNGTSELLERAFLTAGPQRRVKLDVRRYEQVNLTLKLGVRPPELMNAPDWEIAQSRLAAWWKEEVGEPSLRPRSLMPYVYIMNFATAPLVPESELVP